MVRRGSASPAGDRKGRPYGGLQVVQGAGRCRHRPLRNLQGVLTGRRGNRRSAASGRGSEPVSRKCPDWRPQQWPGIGWHDGGQENPAPTELQGVRYKAGRKRYMRCGADKGRPGGPPLRFLYPLFISYIHFLYALFICALRRINLPGAGVYPCRPTRCGPRPGVFPGRWLFPPDRSRCGVRPGSPGPGL